MAPRAIPERLVGREFMNSVARPILGFFIFALAVTPVAAARVEHVVLVSVDGLAARYLDDPKADLPTLRAMRKAGASAEGMITTFPSVTWPSHTSLITGTRPKLHGILANTVFDRRTRQPIVYIGDPRLTKEQAIRVPTVYDAAHAAGLKTASVIWPASSGAKTLDWVIPDANKAELHRRYTTPGLVQELGASAIDISQLGKWGWQEQYGLRRDALYAQVACFLLERKNANLILVHLVTSDGVQHLFGPETFPAYQVIAFEDRCIKQIWDTLQKPAFAANSALFIVSDHGFAPYDKMIRPNIVLRRFGLIDADRNGTVIKRSAWSVRLGGSAYLYFFDQKALSKFEDVAAALRKLEGVESVLEAAEFTKLGLPDPHENAEMAQMIVTTRPGYAFDDGIEGQPIADVAGHKGTHGHRPEPSFMHATFVAAGAGIKAGVHLKTITNIDVAPTIARLLRLPLPTAEGRPLTEILAK